MACPLLMPNKICGCLILCGGYQIGIVIYFLTPAATVS